MTLLPNWSFNGRMITQRGKYMATVSDSTRPMVCGRQDAWTRSAGDVRPQRVKRISAGGALERALRPPCLFSFYKGTH